MKRTLKVSAKGHSGIFTLTATFKSDGSLSRDEVERVRVVWLDRLADTITALPYNYVPRCKVTTR